jgi:hypothetical protein
MNSVLIDEFLCNDTSLQASRIISLKQADEFSGQISHAASLSTSY